MSNFEQPIFQEETLSIAPSEALENEGNTFINPRELKTKSDKIYTWYEKAIQLRNRVPLEKERFIDHHFEGGNREESQAFGSDKDGYLLGSRVEGVFIPTHFAPRTLRGGYKLMKDLLAQEEPVALFITEDLVTTLEKMKGWKKLGLSFNFNFRGEEVKKYLVVNKLSAATKLGMNQVGKFIGKKTKSVVEPIMGKLDALAKASVNLPESASYYDTELTEDDLERGFTGIQTFERINSSM